MKQLSLLFLLVLSIVTTVQAQNVGIGLAGATPQLRLHVSSVTDSNLLLLENRNPLGQQQLTSMYFKTGSWYTGAIKTIGASATTARLGFFTYSSTNINELREGMSILDGGNVGIGTTTPTADFDVNGTIRIRGGNPAAGRVLTSDASGNATWQVPGGGNDIYSVGSVDFKAASSDVPVLISGGNGGAYYTTAYTGNLVAPVHLPNGAKVSQIKIWYVDNSASENISFTFYGEYAATGGYNPFGAITTSGASSGYRSAIITPATPIAIDNTSYGYQFNGFATWPGNSTMLIKSVQFTYSY